MSKASSVSIHISNLRFLAVERFADVKSHASTIINDFLSKETSNYNLRQKLFFKVPRNRQCVMVSKAYHL